MDVRCSAMNVARWTASTSRLMFSDAHSSRWYPRVCALLERRVSRPEVGDTAVAILDLVSDGVLAEFSSPRQVGSRDGWTFAAVQWPSSDRTFLVVARSPEGEMCWFCTDGRDE